MSLPALAQYLLLSISQQQFGALAVAVAQAIGDTGRVLTWFDDATDRGSIPRKR